MYQWPSVCLFVVCSYVCRRSELWFLLTTHLGHVISSDLDDKHDISRGRSALVSQINNVLCFFRTLDSVTKMRLLISYCYSLYGCVIWDITSAHVEKVCSAWRAGVRRVWGAFRSILTMCWYIWSLTDCLYFFLWWDTEAHVDLYSEFLTKWKWSC